MKCKYECISSRQGDNGVASVRYDKCPFEECQEPAAYDAYLKTKERLVAEGNSLVTAIWKAHIIHGIPTAYDIEGGITEWRKTFWPDSWKEIEAKQEAFKKSLAEVLKNGHD